MIVWESAFSNNNSDTNYMYMYLHHVWLQYIIRSHSTSCMCSKSPWHTHKVDMKGHMDVHMTAIDYMYIHKCRGWVWASPQPVLHLDVLSKLRLSGSKASGMYWIATIPRASERLSLDKKQTFSFKNDEDVGMKKAQKQYIIQNGRIVGIVYPFLHSTQYYSHYYRSYPMYRTPFWTCIIPT